MKRDINFIKHIKPQLKEQEQRDKSVSKQIQYEKSCNKIGISPYPTFDIGDLEFIAAIITKCKTSEDEVQKNDS
jgi:hypothetical protein